MAIAGFHMTSSKFILQNYRSSSGSDLGWILTDFLDAHRRRQPLAGSGGMLFREILKT